MKKIATIIMLIMTILSIGFLATNIEKYNENNKKIKEKDNSQILIEEENSTQEKKLKEKKEQYEKLKEEQKEKIEEYEKWEKRVKEIEEHLQ